MDHNDTPNLPKSNIDTDMPPPAYSVSVSSSPQLRGERLSTSMSLSMPSTSTSTPPASNLGPDPYNPYNLYNNPWSTSPSPFGGSLASGSRQPLLGQPSNRYPYSDMPNFPNYPRFDGSTQGNRSASVVNGIQHSFPSFSKNIRNLNDLRPGFGPTPTQHLHIPYAYYDPRSEHSVAQADARARWRFVQAVMLVLVFWILVALIVQGYCLGYFDEAEQWVRETVRRWKWRLSG